VRSEADQINEGNITLPMEKELPNKKKLSSKVQRKGVYYPIYI